MDRNKKAEDKLYTNREALAMTSTTVPAGRDNRLDILHAARCLPGATCSAGKLWLHARAVMGDRGHPALSTYDMASIGLGGCVSSKGWVELHDPASASISIRMFAMGILPLTSSWMWVIGLRALMVSRSPSSAKSCLSAFW